MDLDTNTIVIIGVAVGVFLILLFVIMSIVKSKREAKKEPATSILDVALDGISGDDDRTFNYGFEKQDTVVMNPIEEKKEETTEEEKK